ncbi:MAG TPA: NADH-quinone oxidoreductase subunit I, partial [Sphingobacterium sp.]|nr:NADH-quinone oxidoreductase subunit I [Sphingobacterium sp.]
MQLTNRKKVIEQKPMTFSERIYFPAIIKGLRITLRHFFKKIPTIKYPEEIRPYSKN